jgi:hypothetical protein
MPSPARKRVTISIVAFVLNAPASVNPEYSARFSMNADRRPEAVGESAERGRPDEHPDERRAQGDRQRQSIQAELLREHSAEHAGQEDVEQIEERADSRDDRRVRVGGDRRQPIQPGGDRRVTTQGRDSTAWRSTR